MARRVVSLIAALSAVIVILAGGILLQPVLSNAQPISAPPKDRKDLLIESLERQRNANASGIAQCEAAYFDTVPALQKQVADLTAEVEKLKKPAAPPDAAPPAQ